MLWKILKFLLNRRYKLNIGYLHIFLIADYGYEFQ